MGIKGAVKIERCNEERQQLSKEGENLLRWYEEELGAVTLALSNDSQAACGEYRLFHYLVLL